MNKFSVSVFLAGICWGTMGLCTRHLNDLGIDTAGTILVRCGIAAVCFAILLLLTGPDQFRIRLKDIWCFIGTGIFSLLFLTFCYFHAVVIMDLSTAAILLYTAPTIVVLLSAVLFQEKITGKKILAVVLSFAGCGLVSGFSGGSALTLPGLLYGLGAGLGYALYTIFSRFALQKGYRSNTINFYSCFLAALGAQVLLRPEGALTVMVSSPEAVLWCAACGILGCFVPYVLYTYGLTGMENGRAAVIASVEPVAAALCGVFLYHEKLTPLAVLGILLVLSAVVLLNTGKSKESRG